jgi:Rieske Fe-S protein
MDIKTNEGKVINQNGENIAVYKDETGKVTTLSAVCTHMGCIVGWNDKEKTWDCPCHGSRYDKVGKVINGPAVKDLPKK